MFADMFEWDDEKNLDNIVKHHVSFEEAKMVFGDENRLIIDDEKHSKSEIRYFCFGKAAKGILSVRFTIRGNKIRIIGAGYWREGRKKYEQRNYLY